MTSAKTASPVTGRSPWRFILLLLVIFLAFFKVGWPEGLHGSDRWGREKIEADFPAGADAHQVLLVNAGTLPLFAEIRSAAWSRARCELLLPGDEQWVSVPASASGGGPMELRATALDMAAARHDVFNVPDEGGTAIARIAADGSANLRTSERGDTLPTRSMALVVNAVYRYPVRAELPYDAHERPQGRTLEAYAWAGPGVGKSAGCACAIRPGVQFTCAVPRAGEPDLRLEESVTSDTTTRIVLRWDGTVTRDTIPVSRRLRHWAGL